MQDSYCYSHGLHDILAAGKLRKNGLSVFTFFPFNTFSISQPCFQAGSLDICGMKRKLAILLIFILSTYGALYAQEDTVYNPLFIGQGQVSRPSKAALLSAVFPGAGQVYNKRYWKLPFVYGGAVTFGLIIDFNHRNYIQLRNAIVFESDSDPTTTNEGTVYDNYPIAGLKRGRDRYRRDRDYAIILSTAFYGLVIVDSVVDAHLSAFDVSPDLSMRITPTSAPIQGGAMAYGMGLQFTF